MNAMEPVATYRQRLEERRGRLEALLARENVYSHARLVVFLLGVVLAWMVAGPQLLSPGWLVLPLIAFIGLIARHARATQTREVLARSVAYYETGLSRLAGTWSGQGDGGRRFIDHDHPYARDLDLFGSGSLFALLNVTRTGIGEARLAGWLMAPADHARARARQRAVDELRERLDLREDLAALGVELETAVDTDALASWSRSPGVLQHRWLPWLAGACSVGSLTAAVAWALPGIGGLGLLVALTVQTVVAMIFRRRVRLVIDGVSRPGDELAVLATVLGRFEAERFDSPLLVELRRQLDTDAGPPSRNIARLGRWLELLDSRRNQLFAVLAGLLMWGTQCACAIEGWRLRHGAAVPVWLDTIGRLEALSALAGYAYENPADPFAELVDDGPRLEGEGLGHPLLHGTCVTNDVRLGAGQSLWIVSGSNMSGKSTFLRAIGVNVVLAQAGAPVRARRLVVSPLAVGATMRVEDSLQQGASRFYAEITRLRTLVSIAEQAPPTLLFLLDEILHGTNSHDRRIGAEAVVRGLLERRAIGLVTTHDLALSKIAEDLAPHAANVHFEDQLDNGEIRFDYRLRPGVVQKSNALELMRSIGLNV